MKKKRIILIMILMVSICFLTINVFKNKNKKVINNDLGNTLAIMISNENGIGYKDYEKVTWPSKEYKFKEAKCYDMNGEAVENVVTFNEETRKAKITTKETISCTLYFDKPIITYLRSNDPNEVLSKEEVGGMYRYQGVGVEEAVDETHKYVDNNYICFGTNDVSKCNCNTEENCDKYMYRIIGITEDDQLYLIKMKGVEDVDTKIFAWNSKYNVDECPSDTCDWKNADLYKRLNGNGSRINMSNIFINNERYDYLKEGNPWYEKIMYHDWLYGELADSFWNLNGLDIYKQETGQLAASHIEFVNNERKNVPYFWGEDKKVNAKICIMYMHDYYLAYDNVTIWYARYDANNWILFTNNKNTIDFNREWFLPRFGNIIETVHQYLVYDGGYIDSTEPIYPEIVRPTFYLTNTIQLSGKGTIDEPYIINFN